MTVELDLSRKPSPPVVSNLAGARRAASMISAGVEEKKARMRAKQLWRWIYHYGVTDFRR
jgi:23S rRNA (adenine2503-C2)-methyltransferase